MNAKILKKDQEEEEEEKVIKKNIGAKICR
jgi:hypothetical protein